MPQQLLYVPKIRTRFQKMRHKTMSQCVQGSRFHAQVRHCKKTFAPKLPLVPGARGNVTLLKKFRSPFIKLILL